MRISKTKGVFYLHLFKKVSTVGMLARWKGSVAGSCQIYGSTEQLAGGVVTSHLLALELIHAEVRSAKKSALQIAVAADFCRAGLCRVKACGRLVCKPLQRE